MALGSPARVKRPLTDAESRSIRESAAHYVGDIETYLDKRLKKKGKSLEELKAKGVFVKPELPIYRSPGQKLKFKTTV